MKTAVRITLLSLWICALTVPSLVTVINSSDDPVLVINLNEEEQQELGKKDISEEKIISHGYYSGLVAWYQKKNLFTGYHFFGISNHYQDISLPPPEYSI